MGGVGGTSWSWGVADLHSNETNNSCEHKHSEVKAGSLTKVTLHFNAFFHKVDSDHEKKCFIAKIKHFSARFFFF